MTFLAAEGCVLGGALGFDEEEGACDDKEGGEGSPPSDRLAKEDGGEQDGEHDAQFV